MKGNIIMKTTKSKYSIMSNERIAELENFKTKDFTNCPVQTSEQLQEFEPKYPGGKIDSANQSFNGSRQQVPEARLYKPIKKTVHSPGC